MISSIESGYVSAAFGIASMCHDNAGTEPMVGQETLSSVVDDDGHRPVRHPLDNDLSAISDQADDNWHRRFPVGPGRVPVGEDDDRVRAWLEVQGRLDADAQVG